MDPTSQPPDPFPRTPPIEPTEPHREPTQPSGMATTSMVLGIVGALTSCIVVGLFLGIAALITGLIAIGQIDNPANRVHGRGKATAGAILGGVAILLGLILPLVIGIMLPALGAARRTARQMQNNTQIRSVHQAMVMYSQSNGTYFPGLDLNGDPVDLSAAGRFQTLLEGNYFTGEYLISPSDDAGMTPWTFGQLLPTEYSYALLDISDNGGRRDEWQDTLNTEAVAISDRNTGSNAGGMVSSVHTETDSGDWRGTIGWNDNHTVFETSPVVQTKYGSGSYNNSDNLFEAAGTDDAMLIHDGE